MNMFVLDEQPQKAAEYHCNKHVVKMILEAGQMGCAAHWMSWLDKFGKTRSDFKATALGTYTRQSSLHYMDQAICRKLWVAHGINEMFTTRVQFKV